MNLMMKTDCVIKEQLQRPYMSKVLDCSFGFFLMRYPLQQIKWKNKNIFILEVGGILEE